MTTINDSPEADNRRLRRITLGEPRRFTITNGEDEVAVSIDALSNAEQVNDYLQQVNDLDGELSCDLREISLCTDRERRDLLRFVVSIDPEIQICGLAQQAEPDLFIAMLSAISAEETPVIQRRRIDGAIEAAALTYPSALREACNRIRDRLHEIGLRGYPIRELEEQTREARTEFARSQSDAADGETGQLLHEIWPDAPGAHGLVLPSGWEPVEGGIMPAGGQLTESIPAKLLITRRLRNEADSTVYIELAFQRSQETGWRTIVVSRHAIAARNRCIELAAQDFPVNALNVDYVMDYLAEFETQNMERILQAIVTAQTGWKGTEGADGFLVGRRLASQQQAFDSELNLRDQRIIFRGADAGNEQLIDTVSTRGDFGAWQQLVASLAPFPRVLCAVYASFVAPMLMVLRSPSFVLSFAGPTSGGKTTTLSCAAATWGNPDGQIARSYMQTWDSTRVGIERSLQTLDCLPLIIDDTKQARRHDDVAQTVYDVCGGQGRTRGSERGLAATGMWRTVMITSGEQPLSSFSEDGGTRARILEFWGSPFGSTTHDVAELISQVQAGFSANHGLAGPRFVDGIVQSRSQWDSWRDQYAELRHSYEQRATNPVAIRMAAHFAAIELTARLIHTFLELPFPYADTVSSVWPELTRDTAEADRAEVALRELLNFCGAHHGRFVSSGNLAQGHHSGELFGINNYTTDVGGATHTVLVIFKAVVDNFLRDCGHEPTSMIRMWHDRGWLTANPGRPTLRVRIDRMSPHTVAIRQEVIDQVMGDEGRQ